MPKIKGEEHIVVIKEYFKKNHKYKDIRQLILKNHNCDISESSFKRICKKYELQRKNFTESSAPEILLAIDTELDGSGSNLGYRAMRQRIQQTYGLKVKERTVLIYLRLLDPTGVEQRTRKRLKRRRYKAPGPNFVWHMDGHDKLKPYGLAIHGAIDGFSRKIIWLKVGTTNNDPYVIASHYLQAIKKLNLIPTIIRSDKGTENVQVEAIHTALRFHHQDNFAGYNSFIVGKSTHNQRIEAFWVQLQRLVTGYYMELFKKLQAENLLNIKNKLQIECLRYSYGHLIQYELNCAVSEWNSHKVRRQPGRGVLGGVPDLLYQLPENYNAYECKKDVQEENIDIFIDAYAVEPRLYSKEFDEVAKLAPIDLHYPPASSESALEYYLKLWDAISAVIQN